MHQTKIKKYVRLIKSTENNFVAFHLITCSFISYIKKHEPSLSYTDRYSAILILIAANFCTDLYRKNIFIAQRKSKIESEIVSALRTNCTLFDLKIILYYYSTQVSKQNIFIFGSLLTKYFNRSAVTDYLLCKIYTNYCMRKEQHNKNIGQLFLKNNFNLFSKIKLLPAVIFEENLFAIKITDLKNEILQVKFFEGLKFYAKYSQHPHFIKEILAGDKILLKNFKKFVKGEFFTAEKNDVNFLDFFNANAKNSVKNFLEISYGIAEDKEEFIFSVENFLKRIKKI